MNPLTVLRDSLYFFRRNLWQIAQLCLPWIVAETLTRQWIEHAHGGQSSALYDVLVGLLFYPLYTAALILFMEARSNGREVTHRELLGTAFRLWPTFALLAAFSTVLIMLGMSLMLLPGLYVMVKLVFAEYLLVLRSLSPVAAMRESVQMTNGFFWQILLCVLAVMVPLWLLDAFSAQAWADQQSLGVSLLLDSLNGFLQLFTSVVLFRLFMLLGDPQQRQRLQ